MTKLYYAYKNKVSADVKDAIGAFFVAILFTAIMVGTLYICSKSEHNYSTTASVFEIENNEITLIDSAGYLWTVTNRPDLKLNNFVKIYFNDNQTDYTREDDIIMYVKVLDE